MNWLRITKDYLKHAGMRNLEARLEKIIKIEKVANRAKVKVQVEIMRRKKAGITE